MPAVTGTRGVTPAAPTSSSGGPVRCTAFQKDATLAKVATGAVAPIVRGAPKSESVKTMQAALFSLGFLAPRKGIDGAFGPGTETALKAFQKSAGLEQSGKLDATTLKALDTAASKQIASLQGETKDDGSKRQAFHLVADISDPSKTRLYVLDQNDQVQARYLTSPGRAEYPTQGSGFKVTDVMTRKPWNPPNSGWAAQAKPIPPGLDNPMGLTKLSLGAYAQYIHGIPASEEAELGHAASHGCLRMSGSNVLELAEKYAGTGSDVKINRDRAASQQLEGKFQASRQTDRPTDAGREYLFGYLSGELGTTRHFNG